MCKFKPAGYKQSIIDQEVYFTISTKGRSMFYPERLMAVLVRESDDRTPNGGTELRVETGFRVGKSWAMSCSDFRGAEWASLDAG